MDTRRARLACWNLRWAGLFMAGPIGGLVLVAVLFGLSAGLQRMALGMSVFTLALYAVLIKGEYDRLARR